MILNQIYPAIHEVIPTCKDLFIRDLIERKLLIKALVMLSKLENKEIVAETDHYMIKVVNNKIQMNRNELKHAKINCVSILKDTEIWSYDIETYTDNDNNTTFLCGSIVKNRVEKNTQYVYSTLYFTDLDEFINEFASYIDNRVLCYGWNSSSFDIKFILRGLLNRANGRRVAITGYDRMPFVMIGNMIFLDAFLWYKKSLSEFGDKLPFPYKMYRNLEFKQSTINKVSFVYCARKEDFNNEDEYKRFIDIYGSKTDLCMVNKQYNIRDSVLCSRMVSDMYRKYNVLIPLTVSGDSIATVISLCLDELKLVNGPKLQLTQKLLDSIASHPLNKSFLCKLSLCFMIISKKSYAMNAFKRYLCTVKSEIRKRKIYVKYRDMDYRIDLSNMGTIRIPLNRTDYRDHIYFNVADDAKMIYLDSLPELTDFVQLKYKIKLFSDLVKSCKEGDVGRVIVDNLIESFRCIPGEKIVHSSELLKEGAIDKEIKEFGNNLYMYRDTKEMSLNYIFHQLRDKQRKRLEDVYGKVYMIKDNFAVVGSGDERFTYYNNRVIIGDKGDALVKRVNETGGVHEAKMSDCVRDKINGGKVQIVINNYFSIGIDDKRIYEEQIVQL